jgi:hypothetical protein
MTPREQRPRILNAVPAEGSTIPEGRALALPDHLQGVVATMAATGARLSEVLGVLEGMGGLDRLGALAVVLDQIAQGWIPPLEAGDWPHRNRPWPGLAGLLPALVKRCFPHRAKAWTAPTGFLEAMAARGIHPVSIVLAAGGKATAKDVAAVLGVADDPLVRRVRATFNVTGLELTLTRMPNLDNLPLGLVVNSNLYVGQTDLRRLPDDLKVSGNLEACGCKRLEAIPASLKGVWGLNLRGCVALRSLPDGLRVGNRLTLARSGLETLPRDLRVGDGIDLRGCKAWDQRLPEDTLLGWTDDPRCGLASPGKLYTDDFPDGVGADDYRAWMAKRGL